MGLKMTGFQPYFNVRVFLQVQPESNMRVIQNMISFFTLDHLTSIQPISHQCLDRSHKEVVYVAECLSSYPPIYPYLPVSGSGDDGCQPLGAALVSTLMIGKRLRGKLGFQVYKVSREL